MSPPEMAQVEREVSRKTNIEETMTPMKGPDLRGKTIRSKRLMPDADAREFLRKPKVAHVGTADENGWPYVLRLVFIYDTGTTCTSILAPIRDTS